MLICADSAIACTAADGVGHAQREAQRRRRGVRDRLGAQHLEHGSGRSSLTASARSPRSSRATASSVAAPPEMPSQLAFTTPTSR